MWLATRCYTTFLPQVACLSSTQLRTNQQSQSQTTTRTGLSRPQLADDKQPHNSHSTTNATALTTTAQQLRQYQPRQTQAIMVSWIEPSSALPHLPCSVIATTFHTATTQHTNAGEAGIDLNAPRVDAGIDLDAHRQKGERKANEKQLAFRSHGPCSLAHPSIPFTRSMLFASSPAFRSHGPCPLSATHGKGEQ